MLGRFNQSANMGAADLGRLLAAAEEEAVRHRFNGTSCADVMTRPLIITLANAPLSDIAKLFRENSIKCVSVVDAEGRLLGLVLQADLLQPLIATGPVWRRGWKGSELRAADIMRPATATVPHDQPIGYLLHQFARQGVQVAPVIRSGQLVGILTRSDLMRLLF